MFEKKPTYDPKDSSQEIKQTIKDIERRLIAAEKQDKDFSFGQNKMETDLSEQLNSAQTQIDLLKNEIHSIKDNMKNTVDEMQVFIKLLKLKVKKREYDILQDKIEEWNPEKIVTKNDFISMIKQ
jgi:hypothetical protein